MASDVYPHGAWWLNEVKDFVVDATAGTIGGVIGILTGNPLDVIKTRMQAGRVQYNSFVDCFRHIVKTEGAGALYKGSIVASLGQAPNNFLTFGHYGLALRALERAFPISPASKLYPEERPLWHVYVAGSWAGAAQSVALAPFEHIKVQQQLMGEGAGRLHLGIMEAARSIREHRGIVHGIMRGWVATAWRDIPTFGLYFSSFELTKSTYVRRELLRRQELGLPPPSTARGLDIPKWVLLAGGGLAGIASWSLAIPADVIKSTIQGSPITTPAAELKIATVARRLYQQHGASVFFRGMAPCLIRSVPVNAVTFAMYELTLQELKVVTGAHVGPE